MRRGNKDFFFQHTEELFTHTFLTIKHHTALTSKVDKNAAVLNVAARTAGAGPALRSSTRLPWSSRHPTSQKEIYSPPALSARCLHSSCLPLGHSWGNNIYSSLVPESIQVTNSSRASFKSYPQCINSAPKILKPAQANRKYSWYKGYTKQYRQKLDTNFWKVQCDKNQDNITTITSEYQLNDFFLGVDTSEWINVIQSSLKNLTVTMHFQC